MKKFLFRSFSFGVFALMAIGVSTSFAADQTGIEKRLSEQEKLLQGEYLKGLADTEEPPALKEKNYKLEYGGWVSNIYRRYKDIDNDDSEKDWVTSVLTQDLRFWSKLTFRNKNYIYLRVREAYSQKENLSIYTGVAGGASNEGPSLDMAYMSLKSKKVLIQIGRQNFSLGRGIAYSDTHDGILLRADLSPWAAKGFFSHTLPHEDNVDYSIPSYDKRANNRDFIGLETAYLGIPKNALYAFYLRQRDRSKEYPDSLTQNYGYSSHYFGVGVRGNLTDLGYWAEVIKETGTSYTDASRTKTGMSRKAVDAWAANAGLRYEFNFAARPVSEIEFAYGSGDKDRTSVTNTDGGNLEGKDTNFLYFGNFYGGYALSPRLSNLYIYKFEQSLRPFYRLNAFKDIALGIKCFAYLKDKITGGISDTNAELTRTFVGSEYNLYLYWKINANFYLSLRYGEFHPGDAYNENLSSNTKYYYSRVTFTF